MQHIEKYKPKNHIRIVTAASLFDGHDASINVMRRIIQSTGVEVIHLGHNRSVKEIVDCAVQEDVQAIAITSYQGGHLEYLKYMYDLLEEVGCGHIKIIGGGGGVILPEEIEELHNYGIARIYSPDDGREMGLQGMINDTIQKADFPTGKDIKVEIEDLKKNDINSIARIISAAENYPESVKELLGKISENGLKKDSPVIGITGTGGSGKSSLVDEIVRRYLIDFSEKTIAIISVDPSKRKTGGALLGDRIRMNSINNPRVYMRSLATRQSNLAMSKYVSDAVNIVKAAGYDLIILETSGIGQSDTEIVDHSDLSMYVMTPEYGAATQLEKIDMLDFADIIAVNKFDKRGSLDALRDVKKQYMRNHELWHEDSEKMPVYGTIASQFNDPGVNQLYKAIIEKVEEKTGVKFSTSMKDQKDLSEKIFIIPPNRTRYLSEISETIRKYNSWTETQADIAHKLQSLRETINQIDDKEIQEKLEKQYKEIELNLDGHNKNIIENWNEKVKSYQDDYYVYKVRDKEIKVKTFTESLSHLKIQKISMPRYKSCGDILKWNLRENVP